MSEYKMSVSPDVKRQVIKQLMEAINMLSNHTLSSPQVTVTESQRNPTLVRQVTNWDNVGQSLGGKRRTRRSKKQKKTRGKSRKH